jgi:protease I
MKLNTLPTCGDNLRSPLVANPDDGNYDVPKVTVEKEVNDVNLDEYAGFICIGAYAMDRLRYQVNVKPGQKNNAPAVAFLRKAMAKEDLKARHNLP